MNLKTIPLSEETKKNLLDMGYGKLTNIQEQVIPSVLDGKNVIAQSKTGTGKTAAFLIPTIEKLGFSGRKPQILILVPTRELAFQVSEEAKRLSSHKNLKVVAIFGGGSSRSIVNQLRVLRRGADIIVGTPGRTIDHIFNKKSLSLENLKFFILDEVDEMIGQGFIDDIEKIMKKTPKNKQTLLFSATLTPQVKEFSDKYLNESVNISAVVDEKNNELGKIEHYYLETRNQREKDKKRIDFVIKNKVTPSIIFANTKRKVEQIYDCLLDQRLQVDYIHSDLSQTRRLKVFDKFKQNKIKFLVATDVAARGLDVKGINYVINYDFPQTEEFYVHRVGRTGRAGAHGKALTLISYKEKIKILSVAKKKDFDISRIDKV